VNAQAVSAPQQPADEVPPAAIGSRPVSVLRWRDGVAHAAQIELAHQVPIAFAYNGVSHVVMLATPGDPSDFALGFSLSEGVIASPAECDGVEGRSEPAGITLAGRTSCGICGKESLTPVLRPLPDPATLATQIVPLALARAHAGLNDRQPMRKSTGATQGAMFCRPCGTLVLAREGVGRHNALDNLIGARRCARMLRADDQPRSCRDGAEDRKCQYRAAGRRFGPATPGVRVARDCGLTLISFARGAEFSLFNHPQRIRG